MVYSPLPDHKGLISGLVTDLYLLQISHDVPTGHLEEVNVHGESWKTLKTVCRAAPDPHFCEGTVTPVI